MGKPKHLIGVKMANEKVEHEVAAQMFEVKVDFAFKYGVNVQARTIQMVGEVSDEMFIQLDTAMTILEQVSKAAIIIRINSLGGSVYDGMAIIGRLKASKCQIITEAYGAVMSAAIMILAAGDKRRMSKYAWCMWHEASYEPAGTVSQVRHAQTQIEREENRGAEMMEQFTTAPKKFWLGEGKAGKDLYLSPTECVNLGVVDELF
jgi:ATP-dependent protease ClpP protease subunit